MQLRHHGAAHRGALTFLSRAIRYIDRVLGDPLVARGAPALLFLLLALRAVVEKVSDPDGWWLAAAGRAILAGEGYPTVNGWSYADPAHPWVLHEGAPAVLYALGLERVGAAFFPLVGLLGATLSLCLSAPPGDVPRRPATDTAVRLGVLVACRECLFSPRPGYALLGLAGALALLVRPGPCSLLRCALTVVLQGAWTWSHGSFPLGLALLALGVWESREHRPRRLATLALGALFAFGTPYGCSLPGLVLRYLTRADPAMGVIQSHIAEFAPLWRAHPPFVNGYLLLGTGVTLALALSAAREPRERARGAFVLGLLGLAVWHSRHLVLAVYLGLTLLVGTLDRVLATHAAVSRAMPATSYRPLVLAGALALAAWSCLSLGRPLGAAVHPSLGGEEVVRLAREVPDGARVFVPFPSAGLLLWLRAPAGVRVLVDPRNDCYSARVLTDAYTLQDGSLQGPAALAVLQRYGTDAVLVPRTHPSDGALRASAWSVAARNGAWSLYRPPEATPGRARPSAD